VTPQSSRPRLLGLAHLSLIDVAPPNLVDVAADAGYDFVGVRIRAVTAAESPFDLSPGSPMLAKTVRRSSDRGVTIRDVEFLLFDGALGREDWLPALESAATLGAKTITVAVDDTDETRVVQRLGELAADAAPLGIRPTIEPISYNAVHSIPHAERLARGTGCLMLLDALHVARFGGTREEAASVADLVPLVQLCDGPAPAPGDRDGLVAESRLERAAPGTGDFDLAGLLAELDTHLPVSVETPSATARSTLTPVQWAVRLREATEDLLTRHAVGTAGR